MKQALHARLIQLGSENHLREVVFGSAVGLTVKVIAAGSAFLMNVVIARTLGPTQAGLFFLGFTLVTLLASVGRMGLDSSLVRFVAALDVRHGFAQLRSVYRKAMTWAASLSLFLMLIMLAGNEGLVQTVFPQPGFGPVLQLMSLALPLLVLYALHAQALQGLKKVAAAMITLNVVVPVTLLIVVLTGTFTTALEVASVYIGACSFALAVGYYWWRGSLRLREARNTVNQEQVTAEAFSGRELLASCIPLWGVMVLSQCVQWSSQLLLGAWNSAGDVALFATAQRTAMLTSFVLVAVNAIAAPKFSAMHSQGDIQGLRRVALMSVRLMLVAAVPALLFMVTFPHWLMSLFGDEFVDASGVLVILALGQFVNIATGSVGFLLSMTGHERALRLNVLLAALLGVGLGIVLIPLYGLIGGAIATASAVASQNLLGVYQVNRLLGFNTLAIWRRM